MKVELQTQTAQPIVTISQNAAVEVARLIETENHPDGTGVRLSVKGGGCSGLSYALTFDLPKENDHVLAQRDVQVIVDRKSAIYLKGVHLDFQSGLEGKGFVFQNPNASNTCGCGESFSVL
jgi:iron-sulfur cluster assembly protein